MQQIIDGVPLCSINPADHPALEVLVTPASPGVDLEVLGSDVMERQWDAAVSAELDQLLADERRRTGEADRLAALWPTVAVRPSRRPFAARGRHARH